MKETLPRGGPPMFSLQLRPVLTMLAMLSLNLGCGQDKKHKSPAPAPLGAVAKVFAEVSGKYRLPREILMAVTYKESGFSPLPSRGHYDIDGSSRGMPIGETSVGLPRSILKLGDDADSQTLTAQLEAYGAWIRSNLDAQHLDLSPVLSTPDTIYDWVWQLARMHYSDKESRKNVQILFALETIEILNKGFLWQDADSRERVELLPRNPPLARASFSAPIQANLQLDTRTSEIFSVDYLQLTYGESTKVENQPKKIIIMHCPFSLSSCLGSQVQTPSSGSVTLGAHYVIPADDRFLGRPVKILQHRSPVRLTDSDGNQQQITDAIVVMLVGSSGRYVDGKRTQTDPSWYNRTQLKNLGEVVLGICQLMNRDDPSINVDSCRTPGEGVNFRMPNGKSFRMGDVPDFDPSIFWSFIKNPDGSSGEINITLPSNQKLFPAGTPISVNLGFIRGTAKLEVQLLERCNSGKTVWSTLQSLRLRNLDKKTIEINLLDQGPNLNGQQFLRAMAYDQDGTLMGWDVQDLFLSNFDRTGTPSPKDDLCNLL